ncbi:unnamed protein product [Larinioides sclopetarius]|uniref:Uncharacterized protein n=1 Tax=Larinioides sclopetarius TaxID=280406 RepID=A0AAV1ZGR6_9ARAC
MRKNLVGPKNSTEIILQGLTLDIFAVFYYASTSQRPPRPLCPLESLALRTRSSTVT